MPDYSSPIRLNLGAGPIKYEGWLSIDVSEEDSPDIVANVNALPFEDNSVDAILASHILEHFSFNEPVLEEWWRVLKKGALIIVCVPDFLQLYELYKVRYTSLEYFMASIYGANVSFGYSATYAHKQIFSVSMLLERMLPLFPDVMPVHSCSLRSAHIGECMVEAHK